MSCDITYSPRFARELKKLSKHYKSLKLDYANLLESLKANPEQGVSLGNNLRKVRMAITSKNKGKSGGARVITYTVDSDRDRFGNKVAYYLRQVRM
mgnify:CR=1 FL=1|jgi:mRNA-degrading endonuclease RelE of RelBE toxin-antitoxin system